MSRRRQEKSLIEEVGEVFQHLPWWAGFTFAMFLVALGFVLPYVPATGPLGSILLGFLPWVVWVLASVVLLYTMAGVFWRAIERKRFNRTTDIAQLDPYEFERFVAEYYRRRGYSVTPRGGRGPDGGVDVQIRKGDERLIVQCKHWRAWRVGPRPARELWGLVDHEKASGAVLVTSGVFTEEARAFARGKRLELVDGSGLAKLIAEVKQGAQAAESLPADETVRRRPVVKTCDTCGAPMVVRTATRGPRSGEQFWGCSTFPVCRSIRPFSPAIP